MGKDIDVDELNLEVLSSTARAMSDEDAFDDMVASWDERLSIPQEKEQPGNLNRLLSNLQQMMQLFASKTKSAWLDDISELAHRETAPSAIFSDGFQPLYWNDQWTEFCGELPGANFAMDQIDPDDAARLKSAIANKELQQSAQRLLMRIYDEKEAQHFFLVSLVDGRADQLYLHFCLLSIGWTPQLQELIAEAYGLSDTECMIARLIMQGEKAEDIAERRGAALGTVRKQIQSLLKKTSVSSQIELVQTLSLIATNFGKPKGEMSYDWTDPWHAEKRIIRPGGHVLAYSETGLRGGIPILLIHGEGIGYALPGLPEIAQENGWHIYAIQRPGYGNSDIGEDETGFRAGCAAIEHLCNAIIGKPAAVIAMHAAIPMVLHMVSRDLFRPAHVLALNTILSIDADTESYLPSFQRAWFRMAHLSRKAAMLATNAGWSLVRKYGREWYLERYFSGCDRDLTVIRNPNYAELLKSAVGMMLRQGPDALVEDILNYSHPVLAETFPQDVKISIIAGGLNPTFRASYLTKLEHSLPNAETHIIEDGGELIAYSNLSEIAAIMAQELSNGTL